MAYYHYVARHLIFKLIWGEIFGAATAAVAAFVQMNRED